jgi:hypothetical protein
MALRNPPSYLANAQLPAVNDRLFLSTLVRSEGVVSPTDMVVTASSGFTLSISLGAAFVKNDLDANGGYYWCYNDAANSISMTGANGTFPRIDRVCLRVRDTEYSGTSNDVAFFIVVGTASATPQAPAFPTDGSYYELARLTIPAGVSLASQVTIADMRGAANFHSDALPVANAAALANLAGMQGDMALTSAEQRLWYYSGSSWVAVAKTNDTDLTLSGQLISGTMSAAAGKFSVDGNGNVQGVNSTMNSISVGTASTQQLNVTGDMSVKSALFRVKTAAMTDAGTTTSTTYTGTLTGSAQPVPSVTFTVPPSGCFMIWRQGRVYNNTANAYALLGAKLVSTSHGTVAASDDTAAFMQSPSTGPSSSASVSLGWLYTGYTSGESVTVTAQYRVSSGTGTFDSVNLIALPVF